MNQTPVTAEPPVESEEWFLEQLDRPEIPWREMLVVLQRLATGGGVSQADARGRLLQDILVERRLIPPALRVLALRAEWMSPGSASLAQIRAEAQEIFASDSEKRALLDQAGFDRSAPPAEVARRLGVLASLHTGALCYEKTWGFGIVRRVDHFAKRVEIDFESKKGHQMTFAYAAEVLQVLPPEHLLARLHREPAVIAALVKERPGEIVRLALRSFGPMTVPQVQAQLCPRLLPESAWKGFWETARRELKRDPRVDIPSKRTEPVTLREDADRAAAPWWEDLRSERDLEALLRRMEEAEAGQDPLPADGLEAVAERLAFVVKGAVARQAGMPARAALLAVRFGVPLERTGLPPDAAPWFTRAALLAAARDLPARTVRPFFEFLARRRRDELFDLLLSCLREMEYGIFNDAVDLLRAERFEDSVSATLRAWMSDQVPTVEALLWIHRNPEVWESWMPGRRADLARLTLTALEEDLSGERLRAQNMLRERFARPGWLKQLFDAMTENQQREFMLRLKSTPAWPQLERQALLGRIVKMYPPLEALLRESAAPAAPVRRLPLTSVRSYRERQRQLHKLVHEDIPKNSRDIGHARSYGDLRENFEFKAAKETQAVLMRRQAELEQMLREVQPSEFEGMPTDRAGEGTGVEIVHADGRVEHYYILGAWDRDERLGIIASTTRLAQVLEGHRPGDRITLPTDAGEAEAVLRAVRPLSDEIRAWIRGGS